jgi:hypothetical protein
VGRLEQVAGMRLVEGGDGTERGVRILRCTTGAGFDAAEIASWGIDVIVSGSAIFDRVDPAGNLDLLSAQLRTPEEVSDGQR